MGQLLPNAKQQFFSAAGVPLALGTVDFYIPATTTRKNTYQDAALTILNTNPVTLDAAGEALIYGDGAYRQVVKDAAGNTIWDQVTASWISTAMQSVTDAASITAANVLLGNLSHGQCQLVRTNATTLTLNRKNGSWLVINAVPYQIPSGGVTLSNAGLAISTLFYIYAFISGSTMTLEASTTTHATDTTTGVEIKSGDATRTLVGMVFTDASSQFNDSVVLRNVASYFNRRQQPIAGAETNIGTNIVVFGEFNTAARIECAIWGDAPPVLGLVGTASDNAATDTLTANIGRDGVASLVFTKSLIGVIPIIGNAIMVGGTGQDQGAEGHHFYTPCGQVSGGTIQIHFAIQGSIWN